LLFHFVFVVVVVVRMLLFCFVLLGNSIIIIIWLPPAEPFSNMQMKHCHPHHPGTLLSTAIAHHFSLKLTGHSPISLATSTCNIFYLTIALLSELQKYIY